MAGWSITTSRSGSGPSRDWSRASTGLIAVNRRAGGHAGPLGVEALLDEVGDLGVPVVCAGGVGTPGEFARALSLGYAGAQLGTRFIATRECTASDAYKQAILDASEDDVVLSEKAHGDTGVRPEHALHPAHGSACGAACQAVAERRPHEALDAPLLRGEVVLAAEAFADRRGQGAVAGGKERGRGVSRIEEAGEVVRRYAAAAGIEATRLP